VAADASDSTVPGAVVTLHAAGLPYDAPANDPPNPLVRSRAHWSDGAWTVVLARPLATDDSGDVQFPQLTDSSGDRVHRPLPVAIHIWDGLAGETEHRMAISTWIYLSVVKPVPTWRYVAVAGIVSAALLIVVAGVRKFRRGSN
jgi:hypothetical protein